MKKLIASLLLFAGALTLHGGEAEEPDCVPMLAPAKGQWEIEARSAFFFPSNSFFNAIYNGVKVDYEIEVGNYLCDWLELWTNVAYLHKNGHSLGFEQRTTLQMLPLSIGLKYVSGLWELFNPYIGLGGNVTFVYLFNDTSAFQRYSSRVRLGATIKTGCYININRYLIADLFADYLYIPINYAALNNLGGFRVGAGIGVRF